MKDKIIEILKEAREHDVPFGLTAEAIEQLEPVGEMAEQDMEQARAKAWANNTWVDTASFKLGFRKCWEWLQPHPAPDNTESNGVICCGNCQHMNDGECICADECNDFNQHYPISTPQQPSEGEILNIITIYATLQSHDSGQDGIDPVAGNFAYLNHKARAIKELLNQK